MKKTIFNLLPSILLMTGILFLCTPASAVQYCGETITSTDGKGKTAVISCTNPSANTYVMTITSDDADFTGLRGDNMWCHINGNGSTYHMTDSYTWDSGTKTVTFTITSTAVPDMYTPLYLNMNDEIVFANIQNQTFDWPESCGGGGCTDETAPSVTAVAKSDITYNSIVLTVTASDPVEEGSGIARYIVKNADTQIASSTTSPITLTGLSSGTSYGNIKVFAVDNCGNTSSAFAVESFTTLSRPSQCEGDLGHFGTPATKRIHYKIEYLPTINKIRYEIRGYGNQILDYCQVQTTEGNSPALPITNGVAVWKQTAPAEGTEMGILFLYSTDAIGGNEMNAENLSSFTGNNANLVYYKSRDCEADSEPAYAPTTTPEESSIFNDCQIYSVLGTQYYMAAGLNSETNNWGGGSAETLTIGGRQVLHISGSNYLERGFTAHDVSGLTHVHFDVWTQEAMTMGMKLMAYDNGWKEGDRQTFTTSAGAWKPVDLALSGFNHGYLNKIQGIYPLDMQQEDVYITNLYFYKTTDDTDCYETLNLAEGKPVVAGFAPGNAGEAPSKVTDGNTETLWVTWANRPASEEWLYVDLMNNYNINKIEIVWGGDYSTNYILQTRTEAPSNTDEADDTKWVTVATVTDAAANATKTSNVTATGRYVRIHSLSRSSNCIRLAELRVFATGYAVTDVNNPVITTAEVADDSENINSVKLHLVATDEEDGAVKSFLLNKGDDSWLPIVTDGSDCYTVSDLVCGHYSYQVKARDMAGNMSDASDIDFVIFDPAENLALNKDVIAGYTPGNAAEAPTKANDGNLGSGWTTYNSRPMSEQWLSIDLGDVYQLSGCDLFWLANVQSEHYIIQVAHSEPADRADDSQWYTALEVNEAQNMGSTESDKNHYSLNVSARYVRFKAISIHDTYLNMREFRIFGSGFATLNTDAPVINTASVSYDEDVAYLTLTATDATEGTVNYFRVVNVTTEESFAKATDGSNRIALEGLSVGTAYTVDVQAMDKAGNMSATRRLTVNLPISAENIALNKPVVAGYEWTNAAEKKEKANDGNTSSYWVTYGDHDVASDWLYVDLEGIYRLNKIVVKWGDVYSSDYLLQARTETPSAEQAADDGSWTTLAEVTSATATSSVITDVTGVARYIRLKSKARSGGFIRLGELEVYASTAVITLDETLNNSSTISSYNGATVDVTLNRSFTNTEMTYTLCLPFDMSAEQLTEAFGAGWRLSKLSEDSYYKSGDAIRMIFDRASSLEAGVPYLFTPGTSTAAPVGIEGVVINSAAPDAIGNNVVKMKGFYEPTALPDDGKDNWFLGTDNYLHKTTPGVKAYSFRAFFTLGSGAPAGVPARVVMRGDNANTATDISNVEQQNNVEKFFRDGQLLIRCNGGVYTMLGVRVE